MMILEIIGTAFWAALVLAILYRMPLSELEKLFAYDFVSVSALALVKEWKRLIADIERMAVEK